MAIQWIVRCSMLLYLEGTVIPMKVTMGIQWMVGWTGGSLLSLPHLLYLLWIDWPRHLFRELHNWIRTFVVARKSDAWLGPIIFLLQTRANISLVASTTALASKLVHLVCVPGTEPGCFSHNHTAPRKRVQE